MVYTEEPQEPCTIWQITQPFNADKLSKQEPIYRLVLSASELCITMLPNLSKLHINHYLVWQ